MTSRCVCVSVRAFTDGSRLKFRTSYNFFSYNLIYDTPLEDMPKPHLIISETPSRQHGGRANFLRPCSSDVFTSLNFLPSVFLHLLPLALQPTVGFGLSNNTPPFFPIYHQLSPSSHSQHLKISFYFFLCLYRAFLILKFFY